MKWNVKYILVNLFFISTFFPFVSPFPIDTDVQPINAIVSLILFIYTINNEKKINKKYYYLFILGCLSLFYLSLNSENLISTKGFGAHVSLFLACIIFVNSNKYYTNLNFKLFNSVIYIYFLSSLMFLFFPEKFISIQNLFIRNTNVDEDNILGYRGISVFSTEPGLFAGVLIYFLILNDFLFNINKNSYNQKLLNTILIILMILFSKSGSGYLYLILYLLIRFFKLKYILYLTILFGLTILYIISFQIDIDFIKSNRGLDALQILYNIEDLDERSGIYKRILDIKLMFKSIFYNPFGYGINNADYGALNLLDRKNEINIVDKIKYGFNSSLAFWFISYGTIFMSLFFTMIFKINKSNLISYFFAIIFLTVSYSAAFPAIWILFSLPIIVQND